MRVLNLCLNGLEQAVEQGLYPWLDQLDVDIVALQNIKTKEYKLSDNALYPNGFNAYFFDAEQDDYSGVAILTREMPKAIMTGLAFAQADTQGRFIQADFEHCSVGSVLFPTIDALNTLEDKLEFQQKFLAHLEKTRRKRREFIFCGNFEAAHKTVDVENWEKAQNIPGFLPQERAWFDKAIGSTEYVDAFREANFGENQFSWWPDDESRKRNKKGWRKDYQICTPQLKQDVVDAKILSEPQFSDHAAVVIEYELDDEAGFNQSTHAHY